MPFPKKTDRKKWETAEKKKTKIKLLRRWDMLQNGQKRVSRGRNGDVGFYRSPQCRQTCRPKPWRGCPDSWQDISRAAPPATAWALGFADFAGSTCAPASRNTRYAIIPESGTQMSIPRQKFLFVLRNIFQCTRYCDILYTNISLREDGLLIIWKRFLRGVFLAGEQSGWADSWRAAMLAHRQPNIRSPSIGSF